MLPREPDRLPSQGYVSKFIALRNVRMGVGLLVVSGLMMFGAFAAWMTHVVWVISKLASDAGVTFGQIILGALGIFIPPIGMLHGFMIWFGVGF